MRKSNNIPNVVFPNKQEPNLMNQNGNADHKCKFCGGEQGLKHVGIFNGDSEEGEQLDPEKVLWLCEIHYTKLLESNEYRMREMPDVEGELDHSSREEVSEEGEDFVVILEPDNENKWLKVPDILETDLIDER